MNLATPTLTLSDFYEKWRDTTAREMQTYHEHFVDVCRLVGAPTPGEWKKHEDYSTQFSTKKADGRQGFADVFLRGHFAIEYKGVNLYPDLTAAYDQLKQYRENLNNPPLLIACDIAHWEIHTNFTDAPPQVIQIAHEDFNDPEIAAFRLGTLRRVFSDPQSFDPKLTKLQITEDVAAKFKDIVEDVRPHYEAERIARFVTKLVFCLFVEDIGILTRNSNAELFTTIVDKMRRHLYAADLFPRYVRELFGTMANGGSFQLEDVRWFNGSMFQAEDADIFPLSKTALELLYQACNRNWAHVEPSIFGTIFERTLDASKRAQLGAHYTSRKDIETIVEPVLMQPLRREWAAVRAEAEPIRARYDRPANVAEKAAAEHELSALRARILARVRTTTVLDPACGSGNFLYISLRLLLSLEKAIITDPVWRGLPAETIQVHPRQVYGIEINFIAHALATVVVWIGYIQWRYENGFFDIPQPVLSDMSTNIVRRDAVLAYDADGKPTEPEWPAVDVIVGNPPFLGGNRIRAELGDKYVKDLFQLYTARVGATADLVTYWFERARAQLEANKVKRVGLLSTNSIRGGVNRQVLDRIKNTGDIFMAWSDRDWILDGAAVRVSMIGFDKGNETSRTLDGSAVSKINSDLTLSIDLSKAKKLIENRNVCYRSDEKGGSFDVDEKVARKLLGATNASSRSNSDVVRPYVNGLDVARGSQNMWVIDFGVDTPESEAQKYEAPYEYVREFVKPERDKVRNEKEQTFWWLHRRPAPDMRQAVAKLSRFIATPSVAKHRLFVWFDAKTIPDHQLYVIARDDDYFFGVLHSRLHELWSLRTGTSLEDRPRYTPTTTFETFPFPFKPGAEDFNDPRIKAISAAAKALHEERHIWLTPPQWTPKSDERTLTNLYNALNAQRGVTSWKGVKAAAAEFAPRLLELHTALDHAVVAAYGWDVSILSDDEAILRHLLALNGERSASP